MFASWHLSRGHRLLAGGWFERAEGAFARATASAPRLAEPHLFRAVAMGWLGRREEAAEEAFRAAQLASRPAPMAFFAALFAADAGRLDAAKEHVARGEKDDPRNPYGPGIRAFIAMKEGDRGAAIQALLAADLPPSDEFMLRVLRAMEEARRPAQLAFSPPTAAPGAMPPRPARGAEVEAARLVNDGVDLVENEKYPAAVDLLRKAVSLTPKDPTAHACLGEALFLAGDRAAAEDEFLLRNELMRREEMRGDEQSMLVEGYLGRIDYHAGRADPAFERLSRAVEAGSPSPDDRWFLGLCHWWRGEPREACLAWGKIRRDDPDYLRRRLRELLGLPRGRPPGPFAWVREVFAAPRGKAS